MQFAALSHTSLDFIRLERWSMNGFMNCVTFVDAVCLLLPIAFGRLSTQCTVRSVVIVAPDVVGELLLQVFE